MTNSKRKPPAHLRKPTAAWWNEVVAEFVLEERHIRLLTLACEAWDRGQQAREALKKHGLVYADRFGQPRSRPEIAIERDSRVAFARLLRELQLDISEPNEQNRPPTLQPSHGGLISAES